MNKAQAAQVDRTLAYWEATKQDHKRTLLLVAALRECMAVLEQNGKLRQGGMHGSEMRAYYGAQAALNS